MLADDVLKVLVGEHVADLCIPEMTIVGKDGVPIGRIDLWVGNRSIAHGITYGYEIKTQRCEFKSFDKFDEYRSVCNRLSFVIPHDLNIDDIKIPQDVGLYKVKDGVVTCEKEPWHRPIEIPQEVLLATMYRRMILYSGGNEWNKTDWVRKINAYHSDINAVRSALNTSDWDGVTRERDLS